MDFFFHAHLIYKAGLEEGNYSRQMNATNFEKWGTKKLTPNFPPQAVIVLDNSSITVSRLTDHCQLA